MPDCCPPGHGSPPLMRCHYIVCIPPQRYIGIYIYIYICIYIYIYIYFLFLHILQLCQHVRPTLFLLQPPHGAPCPCMPTRVGILRRVLAAMAGLVGSVVPDCCAAGRGSPPLMRCLCSSMYHSHDIGDIHIYMYIYIYIYASDNRSARYMPARTA